jgi:hypothetical protein
VSPYYTIMGALNVDDSASVAKAVAALDPSITAMAAFQASFGIDLTALTATNTADVRAALFSITKRSAETAGIRQARIEDRVATKASQAATVVPVVGIKDVTSADVPVPPPVVPVVKAPPLKTPAAIAAVVEPVAVKPVMPRPIPLAIPVAAAAVVTTIPKLPSAPAAVVTPVPVVAPAAVRMPAASVAPVPPLATGRVPLTWVAKPILP